MFKEGFKVRATSGEDHLLGLHALSIVAHQSHNTVGVHVVLQVGGGHHKIGLEENCTLKLFSVTPLLPLKLLCYLERSMEIY